MSDCARRIPYTEAVEGEIEFMDPVFFNELMDPVFFNGARSRVVGDLLLLRELRRRLRVSGHGLAVICMSSSMLLLVEMRSESAFVTRVLAGDAETGGKTRSVATSPELPSHTAVSDGVDTGGDLTPPSRSMCCSSFSRNTRASS